MTTSRFRQAWKKEYVQIAVTIAIILLMVAAFWIGIQAFLHSEYPMLAVASGSMCVLPENCDGWTHPFARTLHVGDLIIVQGVAPEEIKVGPPPYGDIIVFHQLDGDDLIVHRAINMTESDQLYFITKGDGNTVQDPRPIPSGRVVGKVIMRVPWIGHLALFMRNPIGIYIIIAMIVLLISVEFIMPLAKKKASPTITESLEDIEDKTKAL